MKDLTNKHEIIRVYRQITGDSYAYDEGELEEIYREIINVCLSHNINESISHIKNWSEPAECALELRRWYNPTLVAGLRLIECPHCHEKFYG